MKPLLGTSLLPTALLAFLTVSILALSDGCTGRKVQRPPSLPVPVTVENAVTMDVPVTISAIGAVEAFNTVSITARVGGQLLEVGFKEGQDVAEGDLLFQIDPRPFQADLDAALANLERDRAQQANAEAEAARYADLVKKDYVTRQDYDTYMAAAAAAKATVQADEAAVKSARLNLDYSTIRAPIAGRTGNLIVKEGNLVTTNSGSPLVTINQVVPIYVSFTIPEQQLADVRRYARRGTLTVQAYLPSDSADVRTGKLTFIDNAVDERTGTILLKATFPNRDRSLWPGQFVHVDLVLTKQPEAIVVSTSAVEASQQGDYLFVIGPDGTAELRSVVRGVKFDGKVVIEKGVGAGERVVTDGQLRLTAGAKVSIKSGLEPGAPQGAAGAPAAGPRSPGSPEAPRPAAGDSSARTAPKGSSGGRKGDPR
jgi:multidrug efflux system membrane fusion protein